jgi:protein-S-isoprenylcysteine O-methyltransferase Ste14
MSLVPAFNIGIWNAWIFMALCSIPTFFLPFVSRGREKGADFTSYFDKTQKRAHLLLHLIYLFLVVYSVFVPLKLGTPWFYAGLVLFVLGFIPYAMVIVNFAQTQLDQPVAKGVYRYSRHPMYITPFLLFFGTGIASASWIFLVLSVVYILLPPLFVAAEERFCLEKYGTAYREYMGRTPRWIGLPKSK